MDYVFTQKEIYIYFCNWQIKHLQILKHGGNIIQGVIQDDLRNQGEVAKYIKNIFHLLGLKGLHKKDDYKVT